MRLYAVNARAIAAYGCVTAALGSYCSRPSRPSPPIFHTSYTLADIDRAYRTNKHC